MRPVTLFTIQWGDLPLEEMCRQAQEMGYEGLELSASHLDMKRAASDPEYVKEVKDTLKNMVWDAGQSVTIWQDSVWLTVSGLFMIPDWMVLPQQNMQENRKKSRSGQLKK